MKILSLLAVLALGLTAVIYYFTSTVTEMSSTQSAIIVSINYDETSCWFEAATETAVIETYPMGKKSECATYQTGDRITVPKN